MNKSQILYTIPSGLGGSFTVKIISETKNHVLVRPINSGWTKNKWYVDKKELTPINKG